MKFITVRDLRTKPGKVWKDLDIEKELVLTNNGKPIALMLPVNEGNLEISLSNGRRLLAMQALLAMQHKSLEQGFTNISFSEIEKEIKSVRKGLGKILEK